MNIDKSLTALADKYGSDKGRINGSKHKYTYLYDLIFNPFRYREICFLEMGLAIGGPELGHSADRAVDNSPSISMWLEYFEKAKIFGFDISDFSHIDHPRFKFVRGDSGVKGDLNRLANVAPSFHIIIDDASHASFHQQLGLKVLFPRLAYGGLYVVEDLQWQSPFFEDNLPSVPKTADFLKSLFEEGKYLDNDCISEQEAMDIRNCCSSFSAFSSVDGAHGPATKLIVIRKAEF